jgi:6-phosphogluconolactonase
VTLLVNSEFASADEVATAVANELATKLEALLAAKDKVHLVLTGGTVGIKTLEKLSAKLATKNLTKLHLWWGDERFVTADSNERNFVQADQALLSKISIPDENIHPMPDSSVGDLLTAAEQFRRSIEGIHPNFDVVLLGMGPDAHVASLFPGSSPTAHGKLVASEPNSPKPPSHRISMSFEALNSADEVWFVVAGSDKASAVAKVFAGQDLPATRVSGKKLTRWFLDQAAASEITS